MSLECNTAPAVEAETESVALAELLRRSLEAAEPLWADNDDTEVVDPAPEAQRAFASDSAFPPNRKFHYATSSRGVAP